MNTQRAKYPFAIIAGLSLVGALAGCSTTAAESETSTDTGTTDTTESTDTGTTDTTESTDTGTTDTTETDTTGGTYTDGEYSATADYQSPNGTETIDVTLSLEDGVITAVEVTGDGDNPNSKQYQSKFAGGIAAEVVGVSIDDISVDKVAGSSLTSAGFNDAVDEIKTDAAS
jgi:uncharacterized protein with FMN-binding domain